MIDIVTVVGWALSVGVWLKVQPWFPNKLIPITIIIMAALFNVANAYLTGNDMFAAAKLALVEAIVAVGIHSSIKNSLERFYSALKIRLRGRSQ